MNIPISQLDGSTHQQILHTNAQDN